MRSFLLVSMLFLGFTLNGQIFNPVKWKTSYKQVNDKEFDLIFTAEIEDGWVIYSQYLESDDGPVATAFYFEEGDHFELVGKNEESGNLKETYDKVFEMKLLKFSHKGIFTQRIKVSDLSKPVSGYLEFMTCDDERCLPPTEEEFKFQLEANASSTGAAEKPAATKEAIKKEAIASESKEASDKGTLIASAQEEANASGGLLDPVQWGLKVLKTGDNTYELVFNAEIEENWNIYSQFTDDNGPVPTYFGFDEGTHYSRDGEVAEDGKKKEGPDPLFDNVTVIKYTEGPVYFTQKVEVSDPNEPITGFLEFMTCDNERCLPPDEVPFKVNIAKAQVWIGAEESTSGGIAPAMIPGGLNYGGWTTVDLKNPVAQCGTATPVEEKSSYWNIFVLGFLGGLLALLTPCVFPMIPLTVSFFTKGSGNPKKGFFNAFMYGFFILLVYLLLSLPFHLMDSVNPDILNDISTNIWLNLFFFAIFIFFAFSFFGYYELTLPASWTNKATSAEGIGGIVGIFFMALTLALVSFSCTGPILGSLLAGALSANGGAWQLSAGMGGFGLALALPFALFAAFPGWMKTLPKSGGWLNSVKVVLGFLELALALKFLSNADLVKHWELLKIEPFLGLWILIFIGLGLYLFGKIKFPHDSPIKKLGIGRISLGVVSFAFVLYLASGFVYNEKAKSLTPLKLLSGLAPPVCYSWFYPCDCPHDLSCFKDLEEGLAFAKKVNKPIMIDFTGHACVNCRKMEENVWPEGQVYKHLKDDFVLISLYVDEKIALPEEEQIEVEKATGGTRILKNYGHKWSHFQTQFFQTNSQPYYVLLSPDGKLLNTPVGYTPDIDEYTSFLKCGLDAFGEHLLGQKKDAENKQLGNK